MKIEDKPRCARCRREVEAFTIEDDILHDKLVLTAKCHGAIQRITVTRAELVAAKSVRIGEAFADGGKSGRRPAPPVFRMADLHEFGSSRVPPRSFFRDPPYEQPARRARGVAGASVDFLVVDDLAAFLAGAQALARGGLTVREASKACAVIAGAGVSAKDAVAAVKWQERARARGALDALLDQVVDAIPRGRLSRKRIADGLAQRTRGRVSDAEIAAYLDDVVLPSGGMTTRAPSGKGRP